jgi:tetratricopeptide (TPR) repeat protein
MDRRSFLLLIGAALTSPAHEWLIARPVADASRTAGRVVTPELADHLDTVTDQLRRMDDQVGGGSLTDVVRTQTDYVVGLLQNGSYTDTIGRRLHTTVAELLRLAGWLSFDSGRHADAQRCFIAALHAAHSAGDRELGANVLGFMSCQAKDLGKYDEATKLADTALAGYTGASPRVSAILHMRAAQAYANAGDATETRRSIEAAYSTFRDLKPDQGEPGWSYWLDEAQINEQIGYCYLKLKDWPRATSHMGTAVRLQSSNSTREGALRLTLLADCYAQQGEPERACELGTRAIGTLATQVDSARCVAHVQMLRQKLTPFRRVPAVEDFAERIQQLLSV